MLACHSNVAEHLASLADSHPPNSASTQNQALSAVLFLYKAVLDLDIGPIDHVPLARMPDKLPVVLSREEVGQLIKQVDGTMWLIVALLYGTGVRLEECVELRVKDLDFDRNQIVVRRGKRQKDRVYLHVMNRGALGVRSPFDRL